MYCIENQVRQSIVSCMKGALDFGSSPKKPKFTRDSQSSLLRSVACSLLHCGLQTRWYLPWIW